MRRALSIATLAVLGLACFARGLAGADAQRVEVTASTIDARVGDSILIEARLFQGEVAATTSGPWLWLAPADSGSFRNGDRTSGPTNVYVPDNTGTHKLKVSTKSAVDRGVWGEVLIAVRPKAGAPNEARQDPDRPHEHAFYVSPTEVTLRIGETVRFDLSGCPCVDQPTRVQWNVPAGVKLSAERQLTAVTVGLHKIRLVSNGITRWLTVRVVPPGPRCARIELAPANAIVRVGASLNFQATCQDERGGPISVPLAWSSSGGSVDGEGHFSGDLPGRFQILARDPDSGVSSVVWVVVDAAPRPIAALFLGPRFARCRAGETIQLGCRAYDSENDEIPCPPVSFTASGGTVDSRARFTPPASAVGTHVIVKVTEPTSGKTDSVDVYVLK